MVIGNGMIANIFLKKNYKHDDIIIFASGVSKSNETSEKNFEREKNLILSLKKYEKKIIYFSTTSINSNLSSKYTEHKLEMEKIIEDNFENFLILRIPNVIGSQNNNQQIIGFLKNSLIHNLPIDLYYNQYKYFIDVEDLVNVVDVLKNTHNKIIDVYFNNKIKVQTLINFIEKITQKKFNISQRLNHKSENYSDNSEFLSIVKSSRLKFNTDIKKLLKKYFLDENSNSSILY